MPTITEVSPYDIDLAGGATLTISGTGLSKTVQVNFVDSGGRSTPARSFKVVSDTQVTAVCPPLASGGRTQVNVAVGEYATAEKRNDRGLAVLRADLTYVNDVFAMAPDTKTF